MKLAKDAHKAWSTWSGVALVIALALHEAMPVLVDRIPESIYDWTVWALAIATPVLRLIDQGLRND